MGYNYYATDDKFLITADKKDAALARFHGRLSTKAVPNPDDILKTTTLEDAIEKWGFNCTPDEMSNIEGIYPKDSTYFYEDFYEVFFNLLAPSVTDGSFLMYNGEDSAQWGWRFKYDPEKKQVTAKEEGAVVVFEKDLTPEQTKHYLEEHEHE